MDERKERKYVIQCFSQVAYKLTEKMLWNYTCISDEVAAAKKERNYYKRSDYTGGDQSGHAYVQDPTVFLATETLEKVRIKQGTQWECVIYYPEDWLKAIDDVIDLLKGDGFIGEVIVRKYFYCEAMGETCKDLGIGIAQYRIACIIGTNRIVLEAINSGLLDVKYM